VVDSKQGSESCVTVRTRSSIKKPKLHGVLVYYDVCCFSSFFREYVALYKLQHFPCLPSVLASDNVKITPLVGDASLVENVILRIHGLNGSQQIAIKNVYTSAAFFSLIHGPPGTGKTKMIVSLIESLFSAPIISALKSKMFITNREPRILICAPSNAAVDELAKRINDLRMKGREEEKLRVLRIGVQNNIDDNLKMLTLDCIIEKELEERKNRAGLTNFEVTNSERTKRKFELLKRSNVVCATLSSSAKELIKVANIDFDILVIDEACQSVETSTLIPLKFNPTKVVLVGDPKQLPPTVISNCKPYEQSLFVRLQKTYQSVLLNVQYRMHPTIVEFPNQYFYDKRLQTHKSVKKRENPYQNVVPPISFIQVNGEERTDSYFSFYNVAEARYIGNIISELMKNVKNYDLSNKIGIITPYKAQMKKIKEVLLGIRKDILDFVCVNTVDGFQGQEKDVILISTVKSKNIGFLSDLRRINVSITRAKHSLIIIGNTKVLSTSNAWKSMLSHYRKKNLVFNHYKSIFIKK
ncbi:tRNA-splicing endonuclease positive effector (SEN1), partial [Trachipleistophora hominis]